MKEERVTTKEFMDMVEGLTDEQLTQVLAVMKKLVEAVKEKE